MRTIIVFEIYRLKVALFLRYKGEVTFLNSFTSFKVRQYNFVNVELKKKCYPSEISNVFFIYFSSQLNDTLDTPINPVLNEN